MSVKLTLDLGPYPDCRACCGLNPVWGMRDAAVATSAAARGPAVVAAWDLVCQCCGV